MAISAELLRNNLSILIAGLGLLAIAAVVLQRMLAWAVKAISRLTLDDERHLLSEERGEQIISHLKRVVRLVCGVAAMLGIGLVIYLTFVGVDAAERVLVRLQTLTWADVEPVAAGVAQFVGVLILLRLGGWLGRLFSEWLVGQLQAAIIVRVEDERVERIGRRLLALLQAVLWYVGAMVAAYIFELPEGGVQVVLVVFEIIVVYCLVRVVGLSLSAAMDAIYEGLVQFWDDTSDALWESRHHIQSLSERIKTALQWGVYVAALMYLASRVTLGGYYIGERPVDVVMYELTIAAVKVIAIWIGAMLIVEISALLIHHFSLRAGASGPIPQRRRTVVPLLTSLVRYGVYFIAVMMGLEVLGVQTTAILAGAGIAGLAIGFGAQNLIRDLVSGFFILFEGYFLVGDWVEAGDKRGVVESITLRSTWIRDLDGMVHIIPNGEIQIITNYSREYVRAVVDVGVAYEGDLERAIEVSQDTLESLRQENDDVTGAATVGVVDFGDSDIVLRLRLPVKPGQHLEVAGEMRRRIKQAYDEQGVEIPFARQVVIFEQANGTQVDEIPIRLVGSDEERTT